MKLEEMVSDRQKFATLVKENAEPDLAAMGLDIISFNVQNFVDGNEVIENLGIDNIVKIKKAAAIARAESERDIKVAQAAADKESNDAAVAAQKTGTIISIYIDLSHVMLIRLDLRILPLCFQKTASVHFRHIHHIYTVSSQPQACGGLLNTCDVGAAVQGTVVVCILALLAHKLCLGAKNYN